ncbi:MAG: UDP-N-acetylmuramoyl-L-alanine--D-glutamate ligase, partial [Actinomycetes bacterium]
MPGSASAGAWTGGQVLVAGIGVSGYAVADVLVQLDAPVTVLDARTGPDQQQRSQILRTLGARVLLGEDGHDDPVARLAGVRLVVTSPGWRPDSPLLQAAAGLGIPVWGEVELAWRLRRPLAATGAPAPWLVVTGTNGKTTTTRMLAGILTAAGRRTGAVGNVGTPVVTTITDPTPYEVLAVELSSFQLHWTRSVRAQAAAVLNLAPDHLDWHGSLAEYAADKAKAYAGVERAAVYTVSDPATETMVREADVTEGARAIGVTLGIPGPGQLGIVDGRLVDRAFLPERATHAVDLAGLADLPSVAAHNVLDALAAAALARAHGVPAHAVRDGLRAVS